MINDSDGATFHCGWLFDGTYFVVIKVFSLSCVDRRNGRRVVFLFHGIICSSADYVMNDPDQALGECLPWFTYMHTYTYIPHSASNLPPFFFLLSNPPPNFFLNP